ncbi:MAG: alanine--tRNA ligase [Rickettsia sp.]|nr:alanine--tRNA ligase [Rickettsia sp.]
MHWSLNEIRKIFLDYFIKNGHHLYKTSSLIPQSDKSLLFTNSGMVQFKNLFLGNEDIKYKKAVSAQKCLRAGGKHNDLDQVGYTKRHLTFFEMLGNFSFGDYFKEEAIYHAWELVTKIFNLNPENLYVTIYYQDEESYNIWKKITDFSDNKIIRIKNDDNFWRMSDTGPCGPCSEIFFDRGEKFSGGVPGSANQDGDRFLEIWNLVFMQYNQISSNQVSELSMKSVDTGMGLERIASVLQNVDSNFEIDVFEKIISRIQDFTKISINSQNLFSYRVIADHLRASSFLISDHVIPSNESAGYVLRRILRRAIRHLNKITNKEEPILYKIVPVITEIFEDTYPELRENFSTIEKLIQDEEIAFSQTLNGGLKILHKLLKNSSNSSIFSGKDAFDLYDTYGFPLDLTKEILFFKGISVDEKEFNFYMNRRKLTSKQSSFLLSNHQVEDNLWSHLLQKFGPTKFVGYDELSSFSTKLISIVYEGKILEKIKIKEINKNVILILDKTVFYGESGGQLGDKGFLICKNNNLKLKVIDTQKYLNELYAHICCFVDNTDNNKEDFSLKNGDLIDLYVDKDYRNLLKINHTATHLLNFALRSLIDKNIIQKGSLVASDHLRFDFNHSHGLSKEQILAIELFVNSQISKNLLVKIENLPKTIALERGAIGNFEEKYKDIVRVVSIIQNNNITDKKIFSENNSIELCGGTHVNQTGEIGFFKIISEKSISSGIRRIEAQTNQTAVSFIQKRNSLLENIYKLLKTSPNNLEKKVNILLDENKNLKQENRILIEKSLFFNEENILKESYKLPKIRLFAKNFNNIAPKILIKSSEDLLHKCKKYDNLLICYFTKFESKYFLIFVGKGEFFNQNSLEKISVELLNNNVNAVNAKNWGKENFRQIIFEKKISFEHVLQELKIILDK